MSFFNSLKRRRNEKIERRRSAAFTKAMARGATPEQARREADRAAKGLRNAAVTSAINS